MTLELQPITFAEAAAFITTHHRHHPPPIGHKFSIAANRQQQIVGVIVVGRPVARASDDGWTAEVTRCCTDGTPNAASMLYRAAWRAARAMGYRKLVTYTLTSEPGTSLRAAGWRVVGERKARSWDTASRPRVDKHTIAQRLLWELTA